MAKKRRKPREGKHPKRVKNMMKLYTSITDARRLPRAVGKYAKLGLFQFLVEIFENNEQVSRENKLTNEAIKTLILDEYPDRKTLQDGFKTGKYTVNYYRDLYNRGRLFPGPRRGTPPTRVSYRYNELGLVVDIRSGTRVLTPTERAEYARKFFGIHSALKAKQESPDEPTSEIDGDGNSTS